MVEEFILSILIPVYNAEKFLKRCLNSIVLQKNYNQRIELLLVNDGATDNSLSIINDFSLRYENINVISRENRGIGATRNELIENAKGKYFWFVDADDYVDEISLAKIIPLLESDLYDMLLMGYYWGTETDGKIIHYNGEFDSALAMTAHGIYNNSLWTRVYRTKIIREQNIKFHSYQMGEDFDVIFKLIPHIGKCKCIDLPLYKYIVNPNSAVMNPTKEHVYRSSEDSLRCMKENFLLIKKFDSDTQRILRIPLNFFLMGYLYSIYVVPFSLSYKLHVMKLLGQIGALPVTPLPISKNHRMFSLIINIPFVKYISVMIDVVILKIQGKKL